MRQISSGLTALVMASFAGLLSCDRPGGDLVAPYAVGTLTVGTATAGSDLDPDGYSLTIAGPGHSAGSIGDSATQTVSLPVGYYSVTLAGVRFNCRVQGANPQHVNVAAPTNPPIKFAIGCTERLVASVDIEPRATSLGVGESLPLQGTPVDSEASALFGRSVTWASSPGARATVSSTGLVLGAAHGSVTITATSEGKVGSLSLEIGDPAASVIVSPAANTIGGAICTAGLTAMLLDTQGHQITGRQVTWTTSDPNIATVIPLNPLAPYTDASPAAYVFGVGLGTATVTASTGLQSGSATVTVATPPQATCYDY